MNCEKSSGQLTWTTSPRLAGCQHVRLSHIHGQPRDTTQLNVPAAFFGRYKQFQGLRGFTFPESIHRYRNSAASSPIQTKALGFLKNWPGFSHPDILLTAHPVPFHPVPVTRWSGMNATALSGNVCSVRHKFSALLFWWIVLTDLSLDELSSNSSLGIQPFIVFQFQRRSYFSWLSLVG